VSLSFGINDLMQHSRSFHVDAGRQIFGMGDPVDGAVILQSGVVFMRSTTIEGDSAVVDVRGAGDILTDTLLLSDDLRLHLDEVVALTACELMRIPRTVFNEVRDRSAAVGSLVTTQLSAQVRRLSDALVDALGCPARARAARRLLDVDSALSRSGLDGSRVMVTQQDLAEYVGTTRPTLNTTLAGFQDAGALVIGRGHITITDREALSRFA
jgi:CRP/FNR family transcriptional regulator, cyclic AMP receptor protein